MEPTNETPVWTRLPEDFIYLGSWTDHAGKVADLYFRQRGDSEQQPSTVIAQYSNDPADYDAGFDHVGRYPALQEAYRLAVWRKLVEPTNLLTLLNKWEAVLQEDTRRSDNENEVREWARRLTEAGKAIDAAIARLERGGLE